MRIKKRKKIKEMHIKIVIVHTSIIKSATIILLNMPLTINMFSNITVLIRFFFSNAIFQIRFMKTF